MADLYPGAVAQQVGGYFPRSGIEPQLVYSVVHITAGLGDALSIARSVEAKQVTASFWTNRNGGIVQTMLDPLRMGPWTNGVLNGPDVSNPRIARTVADKVNPNKRSLLTIENVGIEPGSPITAAQERACADIIGHYHRKYGVPISRETVVGHYQFDSVNRRNCPSTNKAILDRIVAMAQGGETDMLQGTLVGGTPNRKVRMLVDANHHASPDGAAPVQTTLKAGRELVVDFVVTGGAVGGIDTWNAGWTSTPKGIVFGYVHTSLCSELEPYETAGGDLDAAYNLGLHDAQAAVEGVPEK